MHGVTPLALFTCSSGWRLVDVRPIAAGYAAGALAPRDNEICRAGRTTRCAAHGSTLLVRIRVGGAGLKRKIADIAYVAECTRTQAVTCVRVYGLYPEKSPLKTGQLSTR